MFFVVRDLLWLVALLYLLFHSECHYRNKACIKFKYFSSSQFGMLLLLQSWYKDGEYAMLSHLVIEIFEQHGIT